MLYCKEKERRHPMYGLGTIVNALAIVFAVLFAFLPLKI